MTDASTARPSRRGSPDREGDRIRARRRAGDSGWRHDRGRRQPEVAALGRDGCAPRERQAATRDAWSPSTRLGLRRRQAPAQRHPNEPHPGRHTSRSSRPRRVPPASGRSDAGRAVASAAVAVAGAAAVVAEVALQRERRRGRVATCGSTAFSSTTATPWSSSPGPIAALAEAETRMLAVLAEAGRTQVSIEVLRARPGSRRSRGRGDYQRTRLAGGDGPRLPCRARAYREAGLHLDDAVLDELLRIEQEAWWQGARVDPGAVPLLDSLRDRGVRTGLCSNAPYRAQSLHEQLAFLGAGHAP